MGRKLLEEAVRAHPLLVIDLAQIVAARVWEQHDDQCMRIVDLFGHPQRGYRGRATRTAGQNALFACQTPRGEEALFVVHDFDTVDQAEIHRAWEKVFADAFDLVDLGREILAGRIDRADRVCADHLNAWIVAFEDAPDAGDRAARTHARHEVSDLAVGLAPDFG